MGQQKLCDEMYRDSVLSNYSHEQLTPLNSFLNNSEALFEDLKRVKEDLKTKIIVFIDQYNEFLDFPSLNK